MALGTDAKLRALGLKQPSTTENLSSDNFDRLREAVDYEEFRDDVTAFEDNAAAFDDLEGWFGDLEAFDEDQASQFRLNIEQKFQENYHEFVNILSENENYDEWEAEFRYGTTIGGGYGGEGEVIQGVTFHEDGGVSHSGVPIPPGTVEIFGPRVEFSETAPPEEAGDGITVNQFQVTPINHEGTGTSEIIAEAENTSDRSDIRSVSLYIDEERIETKSITLSGGQEGEVVFSHFFEDYGSFEVSVESIPSLTVTVEHPSLS